MRAIAPAKSSESLKSVLDAELFVLAWPDSEASDFDSLELKSAGFVTSAVA